MGADHACRLAADAAAARRADQGAGQQAARRRLARAGETATDVRVIHIRRREHAHADRPGGEGSREYSCQWWVNGHWRTYWCGPGRKRPEDRWISPYLAGPEDKPVRGTERVRVWDR